MISYATALDIITCAISPLPLDGARPGDVPGAVIGEEVRSETAVPAFSNAAMDGFALRSAETTTASEEAPVRLRVAGRITAGQTPPARTPTGSAWEIMTGAALPGDCDAVVAMERVEQSADGDTAAILLSEPLRAGQNRRNPGEDFQAGDLVLGPGQVLSPQAVMALAAIACDAIRVRSPPRIALVPTGSEVVAAGTATGAFIRDANGPYLSAFLTMLGATPLDHAPVTDQAAALERAISAAAAHTDLVITTGGVSAGGLDLVPAVVRRLGGEILFHKVAIRPGKPILFARLPGGQLFFGLPGNPVAVAVGLRFFITPALRRLLGQPRERYVPALAADAIGKRPGVTFFAKALATVDADARLRVRLLPGQESFRIAPLLRANCWAIVPAGTEAVAAGQTLEVAPLLPGAFPAVTGGSATRV